MAAIGQRHLFQRSMLCLAVVIWYSASAVANTSSRKILGFFASPILLTFCQFLVASGLLTVYQSIFNRRTESATSKEVFGVTTQQVSLLQLFRFIRDRVASSWTINRERVPQEEGVEQQFVVECRAIHEKIMGLILKLTAVYTIGFVFVNAGYVMVNVSLAETLRSAEPLVSVFLASMFLPSEPTSKLVIFSMVPIFLGGCLSSMSDTTFSALGLLFVTVSNVSFAMRSLVTKQLKEEQQHYHQTLLEYAGVNVEIEMNAFQVFHIISVMGATWLGVVLVFVNFLGVAEEMGQLIESSHTELVYLVAVNAISYFLYNQMSFYVLSKVTMVTHAVANALRRIVTIIFSVWYFKNNINAINASGICLAIAGVLLYTYAKSRIKPSTPTIFDKKQLSNIIQPQLKPRVLQGTHAVTSMDPL